MPDGTTGFYRDVELDTTNYYGPFLLYRKIRNPNPEPRDLQRFHAAVQEVVLTVLESFDQLEIRTRLVELVQGPAKLGLVYGDVERATEDLEATKRIIVREGYNTRRSLFRRYTWLSILFGAPLFLAGYFFFLAERPGGFFGYVVSPAYLTDVNAAIGVLWIAAGGMIGTWSEFVLRNETVRFDTLNTFDPARWRPTQRYIITIGIGWVFGLLLFTKFIQLGVPGILLNDIRDKHPAWSLLVGLLTAVSWTTVREVVRPTIQTRSRTTAAPESSNLVPPAPERPERPTPRQPVPAAETRRPPQQHPDPGTEDTGGT